MSARWNPRGMCALLLAVLAACGDDAPRVDLGLDLGDIDAGPDVDECAVGIDDCEEVVGVCTNTLGSFTCSCAAGFVGTGRGTGSCVWDDPSLTALTASLEATMSPSFSPSTLTYSVTLPRNATSTTLTPSVAEPTRTTIRVAGLPVASGGAASVAIVDSAPTAIDVVVTTESGVTRTYRVVVRQGPTYVKASNTEGTDEFGRAVSISADGTWLAVSAGNEDSSATGIDGNQADNTAELSGAVYLFQRSGSTWVQRAYVKASNAGRFDGFGWALSLSADGTRLAVGAAGEASRARGINGFQDDDSGPGYGAAYVFARTGTVWTQEAYIKASNSSHDQAFGYSVSLSADGRRLAVGGPGEWSNATGIDGDQADHSAPESGAVYVFSRGATGWLQEAYVKASNTDPRDYFGSSVALSADGTRLAVGALGEVSAATGVNGDQTDNTGGVSGAVYVFLRAAGTWTQVAYVKPSNTGGAFGSSVSFDAGGTLLAVGAPRERSGATGIDGYQADISVSDSGAAYVFALSGMTWAQQAYIKASNTDMGDRFGQSVSLTADGTRLGVGATLEDSNAVGIDGDGTDNSAEDSGALYVFTRAGAAWTEVGYVKAPNADARDLFGQSASLSADGTWMAVSAMDESSSATGVDGNQADNGAWASGAVYVYYTGTP